ncbi:VC2662 family protein [Aeromonas salmonicida]|uniref:VC2662 family protein n=1 Tax=Aeromonas salmonicida TaxID=645 RepID=UPI00223FD718|nr:phaC PHA synthase [Aeromonas salmonicida]
MKPAHLLLACGSLALSGVSHASTPIQVSLPGVNLPASHQVEGARASFLYGRTGQVKGIDLPILALSDVDQFSGLQLGVFLGAGRVRHQFNGVAINAVNWHEGQNKGVNLGFVNLTNNVQGLNWGAVNIAKGNALANVGFVNYAERTTFQLGFINATKHLDGLQIGLANYAENGIFPILPLINFKKSF